MHQLDINSIDERLKIMEVAVLSKKVVLNLNEASLYLGISQSYLYKLTSNNIVPHYKPNGKLIFFNRVELEEWMLKNKT